MSDFIINNFVDVCSKYAAEQSCAQIGRHAAFVPALAAISGTALLFTAYQGYSWKKKADFKKTQENEAKLAEKQQIESARQKAQDILRQKENLIQECKRLKTIEGENKNILDSLFVSDWSIPVVYPEGAKELGFVPENASSKNAIPFEPAFNAETKAKITEIRRQFKESIESNGEVPLPNILLYGVAGVGKTMLVAHLCKTTGIGYIKIPTGTLESRISTGDEMEVLNKVMQVAGTSSGPVVIMLDDAESLVDESAILEAITDAVEAEALLPWQTEADRTNSNDVIGRRRSDLIKAIINLAKQPNRKISFALTTNRPDVVSKDFKENAITIDIQAPKKQERAAIWVQGLTRALGKDNQALGYISQPRLARMVDASEGWTGRNIIKGCEVIASSIAADPESISDAIIDKAIEVIKPSVEALRRNNG